MLADTSIKSFNLKSKGIHGVFAALVGFASKKAFILVHNGCVLSSSFLPTPLLPCCLLLQTHITSTKTQRQSQIKRHRRHRHHGHLWRRDSFHHQGNKGHIQRRGDGCETEQPEEKREPLKHLARGKEPRSETMHWCYYFSDLCAHLFFIKTKSS